MEKTLLEKALSESLDKNFQDQSRYFEYQFSVLPSYELGGLITEINKCLILGFNRASITLTNHLLERLLKLALICNEVAPGPSPVEEWDSIFSELNQRYTAIDLNASLGRCKSRRLITKEEHKFLNNSIRDVMRNGFSHANPGQILRDAPDRMVMYQGSFSSPSAELIKLTIDHKSVPDLQAISVEAFATDNAPGYFDYVYRLAMNIDKQLADKLR